jgi:hypothetical protein
MKTQLMLNRIAHRLALKEENLWARLNELRARRADDPRRRPAAEDEPRQARPAPEERQLLELLLAEPALAAPAAAEVRPDEIHHPGLRRLLEAAYAICADGTPAPSADELLDRLRVRLADDPVAAVAPRLQAVGLVEPDRGKRLRELLAFFRGRRTKPVVQELHGRLHAADSHEAALELLRQLQNRDLEHGPGPAPVAEAGS